MQILIVDDDINNRKLLRVALEKSGYHTIEAEDGEQAVRLAKESAPDLILMDIQMPVMDGISAIKAIRSDEATKNIPAIAVTSYAMKGDDNHFLSKGFDEYVSKPINIMGFLEIVRKIRQEDPESKILVYTKHPTTLNYIVENMNMILTLILGNSSLHLVTN